MRGHNPILDHELHQPEGEPLRRRGEVVLCMQHEHPPVSLGIRHHGKGSARRSHMRNGPNEPVERLSTGLLREMGERQDRRL
jgi:hypothetical protein